MEVLVKITSKGQVTIPKKMRELLGTNVVRFRVEKGKIILEPVRDVGGIFKKICQKASFSFGLLDCFLCIKVRKQKGKLLTFDQQLQQKCLQLKEFQ